MRVALVVVVTALLRSAIAVFADEAWNIDYHRALLGEPVEETTFFHQPNPGSRASLIYTLSERGVLGAVNPRDGGVVWRQLLLPHAENITAGFLKAGETQDTVISGIRSQLAAWSAANGKQAWELQVTGMLEDLEILELSDGKETPGAKDALVMVSGDSPSVLRVDCASGAVKWQYKLDGTDTPYQVSASSSEVFAILLHKTMLGSVKVKVISLDPVSGRKTDEYVLSSDSELASSKKIVSVGANSASPIIAWTDATHSVLKVNIIGQRSIASFNIDKHGAEAVERVRLHAPYHVNSQPHFLVHYETPTSHWAEVFHVDLKINKVQRAYTLPKLAGKGAFSTSTSGANVYFTRITSDEVMTVSSVSHGVLGRWSMSGSAGAASIDDQVEPVHAVSEVSVRDDSVSAIRSAVLLSTGDWVLLRDGSAVWQRTEMLAKTVAATFVLPRKFEAFAQGFEAEAYSSPVQAYIHRVNRHINDLQRLPSLLQSLPQRIVNGFLGTSSDGNAATDVFGFHQVVVCGTASGRLVALDAGNPNRILWNRQAASLKPGEIWKPNLSSPEDGVLRLTSDRMEGVQTFNVSTGERLMSSRRVPPERPEHSTGVMKYILEDGTLEATVDSKTVWHFIPMDGERLVSLVPRPVNDPVASIGKVLGDRRVLYKYLDSNTALLVTSKESSHSATIYVLNTVSGSMIYSNTHTAVDLSAPISSIMSENWFAYSFTSEASEVSSKGHQLVVGELFESLVPNDRGPLSASTNFSSMQSSTEPVTLTQTYQIPEAISKMEVTRTRQGITSRQLLALLPDSNAVVGIPYGALDPRRPVNRDPTKDEQAEGLTRYSPVIEFDPKWYLSHQREVMGMKDIITSPALIESTSLVFAYGLDVFGTRLSPSFSFDILGKDFNKFQMLATVAALAVGTIVVAPLVTRKQVDTRWQYL